MNLLTLFWVFLAALSGAGLAIYLTRNQKALPSLTAAQVTGLRVAWLLAAVMYLLAMVFTLAVVSRVVSPIDSYDRLLTNPPAAQGMYVSLPTLVLSVAALALALLVVWAEWYDDRDG